ncbi:hypothetical protein IFR04_014201 [Cadophora malorum]|uniref:EF-hand domain-containing protein n=1 Tax=Cadophora malorum TaxID=108018 RepID=A0A8H7W0K7_9HELO|nr:hypothetical protein IFR04_014201 [Cadophora malorum]
MLRPASTKTNSSFQADGLDLPRTTLGNHASYASDNGNISDFVFALDSKIPDGGSDTEIARTFEVFDREKSGKITPDGLYLVLEILGQRMDKNQLSAVFKEADLDHDGVINCMSNLCRQHQ